MKLNSRCEKGVAWDDFDSLLEAIKGKETLHKTNGITHRRRIN